MYEISHQHTNSINNKLSEVRNLAQLLQSDHQQIFDNDPKFSNELDWGLVQHANGSYYKEKDDGGSSVYYASQIKIHQEQKYKVIASEQFDPLFKSIVNANVMIQQAYFNSWDNMNRLYPFIPNSSEVFGSQLNMAEFNFYYLADKQHNPDRKPVWTGVYLDPAGQGWLTSCIVPIYNGDFLEGVSGLDVTVNNIIDDVLSTELLWQAESFLVNSTGELMAISPLVEELTRLKELKSHEYSKAVSETVKKPKEFNINNIPNKNLSKQLVSFMKSGDKSIEIELNNKSYIFVNSVIPETGWKLIVLVNTDKLFSVINKIENLSKQIGYWFITLMLLFYTIFFGIIRKTSIALALKISTPIKELSESMLRIGRREKLNLLSKTGIDEIDKLYTKTEELESKLDESTKGLFSAQLQEKLTIEKNNLLQELSEQDFLTKLLNRRKLDESLDLEVARSSRYGADFSVIIMDLDHFKNVNDTFGHNTGDQVLVDVAKVLSDSIRNTDIIGRWGGEEFLIICPNTTCDGAKKLAETVRFSVEKFKHKDCGTITGSFGVAQFIINSDKERLIAKADSALYSAKKMGKNCVM